MACCSLHTHSSATPAPTLIHHAQPHHSAAAALYCGAPRPTPSQAQCLPPACQLPPTAPAPRQLRLFTVVPPSVRSEIARSGHFQGTIYPPVGGGAAGGVQGLMRPGPAACHGQARAAMGWQRRNGGAGSATPCPRAPPRCPADRGQGRRGGQRAATPSCNRASRLPRPPSKPCWQHRSRRRAPRWTARARSWGSAPRRRRRRACALPAVAGGGPGALREQPSAPRASTCSALAALATRLQRVPMLTLHRSTWQVKASQIQAQPVVADTGSDARGVGACPHQDQELPKCWSAAGRSKRAPGRRQRTARQEGGHQPWEAGKARCAPYSPVLPCAAAPPQAAPSRATPRTAAARRWSWCAPGPAGTPCDWSAGVGGWEPL